MSSEHPVLHRLRLGDLANPWAESPDTPSQIALLGEFDAGPAAGRGRPPRRRAGA